MKANFFGGIATCIRAPQEMNNIVAKQGKLKAGEGHRMSFHFPSDDANGPHENVVLSSTIKRCRCNDKKVVVRTVNGSRYVFRINQPQAVLNVG